MTTIAFEEVAGAKPAKADLKRLGRRLSMGLGALGLAIGVAWYAEHWWTVGRFTESTDDACVGGNITPLAPHIDAFVDQVLVTDNQRVEAGQVLIRLDPRDYRTALDRAQAVLQARSAAVASLRAQYALQQSKIRQQDADLVAKKAQATFAAQDALRYRVLAQSQYGSRQNEERSSALERESQSAVASAQAGLDAAHQQLKVLDAQISEAEAAVMQAQADLNTAQLNLVYTEIRSPIDGYVGNRAAGVGAYATKGAYLISVTPAHGLWVDANFKEDQLARMAPGQAATVTVGALPGHVFHGRVASLTPGTGAVFSIIPPENATGNFTKIVQRVPVRIVLGHRPRTAGPGAAPRSAAHQRELPAARPQARCEAAADRAGARFRHPHRAAPRHGGDRGGHRRRGRGGWLRWSPPLAFSSSAGCSSPRPGTRSRSITARSRRKPESGIELDRSTGRFITDCMKLDSREQPELRRWPGPGLVRDLARSCPRRLAQLVSPDGSSCAWR